MKDGPVRSPSADEKGEINHSVEFVHVLGT